MTKVRTVTPEDAPALLTLLNALDFETSFWLLEPGERTLDADGQRKHIETILSHNNSTLLVAARDADLVGFIEANGGQQRRNRYTASIGTGVLEAFSGQGIATRLLETLNGWAQERQLRRLELTVMTHNERALAFYRKMGFEIEGTRRDALRIDGKFIDEYYLAKRL